MWGDEDIHVDEDCFDVGRIAGHREQFAAIVRSFGGELVRGELAGQVGCGGVRWHRDECPLLGAASGEPGERFGNAAGAGIGRCRIERHDRGECGEADVAIGARERVGQRRGFAIRRHQDAQIATLCRSR